MDSGAGVSQRRQAGLSLMPETYERVKEHGIRVVFRLEIPPGRYQLRVGALTPDTGLRGSVFFDLEVPDFAEDLLSMSNVVLTSAAASRVVTAEPDQQLSEMLPASPTAVREFAAGDQIDLLTEIYDNDSRPHRVDISGSVFTDTGDLVFRSIDSRYNDEFGDTRVGSYGVALTVPLAAFEPGLYVFRIQAQSRVDRSESIVREVQFRIRG
jgi:hypothetical protein